MSIDDMINDFLASFPAGFGPESDGVPEPLNDVPTGMPAAPRRSRSYSEGNTVRIRKVTR